MWMEIDGSIDAMVVATSIPAENGPKNPVDGASDIFTNS